MSCSTYIRGICLLGSGLLQGLSDFMLHDIVGDYEEQRQKLINDVNYFNSKRQFEDEHSENMMHLGEIGISDPQIVRSKGSFRFNKRTCLAMDHTKTAKKCSNLFTEDDSLYIDLKGIFH
ncbi:hypothetical protein VNO78_33070 [Psophocarpus tetragonolobus]|uniref:Uncharacterized protein n=1 Tax=Psophocarpus tetragonolobus TaxID=3891 RepID=A0AAN9P0G6_PSOTE